MKNIPKIELRLKPFIQFAYGNQHKDKSKAGEILENREKEYKREEDFYGPFRESLTRYEEKKLSQNDFLNLSETVSDKKKRTYKILSKNYIELKEDYGLIWEGRRNISCQLGALGIQVFWYLRSGAQNQNTVVALNFEKEPLPRRQEKGAITLLQYAAPESAGAGILNIQYGSLTTLSRLNQDELDFLEKRAEKFLKYVK